MRVNERIQLFDGFFNTLLVIKLCLDALCTDDFLMRQTISPREIGLLGRVIRRGKEIDALTSFMWSRFGKISW